MTQPSALTIADTIAAIALVLAVGTSLAGMARRLRQPTVIAEIMAGIVLGPSVLGLLPGRLPDRLIPVGVRPFLAATAEVGILLFMFLVGWEADTKLLRAGRIRILGVSLTSMILPFGCGVALAEWLYRDHGTVNGHHVPRTPFVLFTGTAMAITAFPVLARIIRERRLQSTPVGALALSSAAFGDVIAWCLLALVSALAKSQGPVEFILVLGYALGFAAVMALAVRPIMRSLLARMVRRRRSPQFLLTTVAAGIFLAAFATAWIGLDAIFGAFAFGLVMPRDEALEEEVRRPVESVTTLLMPIFFIATGLSIDVTKLGRSGLVELAAIIGVACFGKLAGATAPARLFGMSWRDSTTLGLLMNTRGLTELVILNVGATLGVLDTRMFTMMVVMALTTTAMAGPLIPHETPAAATPASFALQTSRQ